MQDSPPHVPTRVLISRRELRQRFLPFVVFGLVLAVTVVLWRNHQGRSGIVGQAEAVRSIITAVRPGIIVALKADLLQRVKQGDVLAQIAPTDLEAISARLAADVEALRAQLLQSSDRNSVNYQQLRLDWLRRNVDLATARVEFQLAESDFQRATPLHQSQVLSDAEFETKRANRDALKDKVSALVRLTTDLDAEITRMQSAKTSEENPADRAISSAIVAQRKQLESLAESASLRAPIDGVVSAVQKHVGENAVAGEAVLTLGSLTPSRIVAYVRQPLDTQLKPGDLVDVASRTAHRATASAHVLQVGTQLEPIEATLLPPTSSSVRVVEYGLPLLIELPAALKLAPGEIVSVSPRLTN